MTSAMHGTRRLIALGAMLVAATPLAACGSARVPAPASASTSTPGPGAAGSAAASACGNAALRPSLAPIGAAAGTTYYALRLTNVSGHSCTLYGFPGVSFVGMIGQQIGSAAMRDPIYPATRVVVPPNATAHARLGIAAAGNYPPSRCRPATADALRVFLPGRSTAMFVKARFATCSAPMTVLTVSTMQAGAGRAFPAAAAAPPSGAARQQAPGAAASRSGAPDASASR